MSVRRLVLLHVVASTVALAQVNLSVANSASLGSGDLGMLSISGNWVFVANGSTVRIVDVTNPLSTTLSASSRTLTFPGAVNGVQCVGGFLYVGLSGSTGHTVYVLDASAPSSMTLSSVVGTLDLAGTTPAGSSPTLTAPALQATDVWDQNTYLGTFNASVSAAGRSSPTLSSVAAWRNVTTDAGNAFDVHSLPLAPAPTTPAVFITSNDYEPGRARVALFNWGLAATVPVDLSGVVAPGATVTFTPVRAPFGPAVLSASWNGAPLAVPTGGAEFVPLLLTFAASPDGGSNDGGATNDGGSNDGGATNDGGSNDGGATNDGGSNDGGPANDGGATNEGWPPDDGGPQPDGGQRATSTVGACGCSSAAAAPMGWALLLMARWLSRTRRSRRNVHSR